MKYKCHGDLVSFDCSSMRYNDLEMFLCGLELTHLLPVFQVKIILCLSVCQSVWLLVSCMLSIISMFRKFVVWLTEGLTYLLLLFFLMLYVNLYVCDKQQEPCKICTVILRVIFIKLSVYYTCQVNMVLNQSAGLLQSVVMVWVPNLITLCQSIRQSIAPLFHQSVYGSISWSVS